MPTQPTRLTTAGAPVWASTSSIARWTWPLPWATQHEPSPTRISPNSPRGAHRLGATPRCTLGLLPEKIVQHVADHGRRQPPIGDAVDLHHRGQRATAQAGHLFDREEPFGVGVVAGGDFQPPLEGVLDQLRAFHVTGRAVANVDDVAADRAMPELGVERRHAHNRRRRDVGQLADPLDRLARHVAIVRLDRLEDRNHDLAAAAEPLDGLIDESEIEFGHYVYCEAASGYLPRQNKLVLPRR